TCPLTKKKSIHVPTSTHLIILPRLRRHNCPHDPPMPNRALLLHTIKILLIRASKHVKLHWLPFLIGTKQRFKVNLICRIQETPPGNRSEVVALLGAGKAEWFWVLGAEDDHIGEVDGFSFLRH